MKGSVWFAAAVVALCASFGLAATFEVEITATSITAVGPGGTVDYEVTGLVSSGDNLGLALCGVDLTTDTAVAQGQADAGGSMGSFVKDDGITNPAGYGGTVDADDLLQIGGGQNTIGNDGVPPHPAYPSGVVVLTVAQGSSVVLATGTITAPAAPGTYTVSLVDPFANVLLADQGGGVYTVEAATPSVVGTAIVIDVGDPTLVSSDPAHDTTFAKIQNNCIWLTFDRPPVLTGGNELLVRTIGTTMGPDLGGLFTCSIEPDGVTLKAKENVVQLVNTTWYRFEPNLLVAAPFAVDVCTLYGNANNDTLTFTTDYGTVKAKIPTFSTDIREDINGDGIVFTTDYGFIKSFIPTFLPAKPAG